MNAIEGALYTRLAASTALTGLLGGTAIYNGIAKQGAAYPLVIFNQMADTDDNDAPSRAKQLVYQVQAVAPGLDSVVVGSADSLIDALLHHQLLTVSGWSNFWIARESGVRYVEYAADGKPYQHAGGLYRIRIDR